MKNFNELPDIYLELGKIKKTAYCIASQIERALLN